MKKVLAIMGSPRRKKNTEVLLDRVLEGFNKEEYEIQKVCLGELKIAPCNSCYYCSKTGKCCIKDQMQDLYKAIDESDCVIVASPLYFNTISSHIKIMIDRCHMIWTSRYILKKPSINLKKKRTGIFLCVGGSKEYNGQFKACIPVMDAFFKTINADYKENLFCSNTDKVEVLERKDILNKAYKIGKDNI